MSVVHDTVDVRVSQRILWFDSEAYPLHNITRINTTALQPHRSTALRHYLLTLLLVLLAAVAIGNFAPGLVTVLAIGVMAGFVVYRTYMLLEFLKLTLYKLVVETAAGSLRGLVSDDSEVVSDVALRITDAINNPMAEFQMQVDNFQLGDNFNVFGNNNVGKKIG